MPTQRPTGHPSDVTILANARVVTPDGCIEGGSVSIQGDRITAVSPARPTDEAEEAGAEGGEHAPATVDLDGSYVLPGFVDMHCHGGGGASYTSGDPDDARSVAAFHRRHGTTTTMASLVTAPLDDLERSIKALAPLVAEGTLAGLHLEGPYLSRSRCGAHNPSYLRKPDVDELKRLLDAGDGAIRMITIAPELPEAEPFIEHMVAAGVIAAVGHTDATYSEARLALTAGARVGTHLYNAMRGLHHREPGPAAALLEHKDVVVELINDGVHLHESVIGITFDTVGAVRIALVTDAMAAAGMGDGLYPLGPMTVRVEGGVARLMDTRRRPSAEPEAIAGSTLTMDVAVRRAVKSVGLTIEEAVVAASATPARVLGIDGHAGADSAAESTSAADAAHGVDHSATDRDADSRSGHAADRGGAGVGSIEPGKVADLVVLDDDLAVSRVMHRGRWV